MTNGYCAALEIDRLKAKTSFLLEACKLMLDERERAAIARGLGETAGMRRARAAIESAEKEEAKGEAQ